MNIQDLSIDQLLFDRQESFNDIISLLIAKLHKVPYDEKRLLENLKIIETIRVECKHRGFDPAIFDQIMKVKNEL